VGADSPTENIIATIIGSLGAISLPLLLPFAHRFGRRSLFRGVLIMSIVIVIVIGVFAMKVPFDAMHQKRLFVLHVENVSFGFSCLLSSSSSLNNTGYHQ
jgi:type III secretory pathway component EscT